MGKVGLRRKSGLFITENVEASQVLYNICKRREARRGEEEGGLKTKDERHKTIVFPSHCLPVSPSFVFRLLSFVLPLPPRLIATALSFGIPGNRYSPKMDFRHYTPSLPSSFALACRISDKSVLPQPVALLLSLDNEPYSYAR